MIRTALTSVLARKLRLATSIVAVVLGVALVVGTLLFGDTLNRSFTALFASTVGDVVVRPESGITAGGDVSTQTLPASLVAELAELPGAARADGMVDADGVFVIDELGKPVGGVGPPTLGANWSDAPAGRGLAGLRIAEGREPAGEDEVVLDATTAERAGYVVGDRVPIVTTAREQRLRPLLVGIADFADGGSLNGATLSLFDTATAQRIFLDGKDAYSEIWVTAGDGVSQGDLAERARDSALLPDRVEAVTGDDAAEEAASDLLDAISFLTTFLLVFAGISLVVGSFLIVNTFSILVAQRSRELALLRALGASSRQVTGSVLLEALVLGLLGSTVGFGLGVLLAVGIRALVSSFGLDLAGQALVVAPRTVLAAYAVGVLVTMAAAWLPARRTGRIAPVQAMRDEVALPESSVRRRALAGLGLVVAGAAALALGLGVAFEVPRDGWFVGGGVLAVLLGVSAASPVLCRPVLITARAAYGRLFGSVGTLAGLNALRNPRRTTATASALMIGLTLTISVAVIGSSAKASVDQTVADSFVGDYLVSNPFGAPFSAAVAGQAREVPGVTRVVRQRYGIGLRDGERELVAATRPDEVDALRLQVSAGSADDLTDGTVLVSERAADDEDLQVGDTVDIALPTGEASWPVVGVFRDSDVLFGSLLTTTGTLLDAGFQDRDNALIVFTDPGSAGVQDRLDAVVADLPVVTVKDQRAFAAEQREPIDRLLLTVFALLGLALVIAVLGIVNTLALSIVERTREVGLLRAVGLSRRQLRLMVTLESVVIAVLGALLGLVLGVVFGVVLMRALRDQGLEVIRVPVGQLAAYVAVAVVVGVLAAVLPARRAARLDVLRAIGSD